MKGNAFQSMESMDEGLMEGHVLDEKEKDAVKTKEGSNDFNINTPVAKTPAAQTKTNNHTNKSNKKNNNNQNTKSEKNNSSEQPQNVESAESDSKLSFGKAFAPAKNKGKEKNETGLPDAFKNKMENAFDSDFSNVKTHFNSKKADELNAQAFTQGNNVHFGKGFFDPTSSKGQKLIAHELSHVVQQRKGKVKPTKNVNGTPLNDQSSLETEADIQAERAVSSRKSEHFPSAKGAIGASKTIQRAMKQGTIIKPAHLRKVQGGKVKTGMFSGKGKKLKQGDKIEADESDTSLGQGWIKAKNPNASTGEFAIRKNKISFEKITKGGNIDDHTNRRGHDYEGAAELLTSHTKEPLDKTSEGLESGWIKKHHTSGEKDGKFADRADKNETVESAKLGLDAGAGGLDALGGLASIGLMGIKLKQAKSSGTWDWSKALEGSMTILKGGAQAISGGAKAIDAAKQLGSKEYRQADDKGFDKASKEFSLGADGIGALMDFKDFLATTYKIFSQKDISQTPEGLQKLATAVQSGMKITKTLMELIGGDATTAVVASIPGIGVVIHALSLVMDLSKWVSAKNAKKEIAGEAEGGFATILNFLDLTEEQAVNSNVFEKQSRGSFGGYQKYYRLTKNFKEQFDLLVASLPKDGDYKLSPDEVEGHCAKLKQEGVPQNFIDNIKLDLTNLTPKEAARNIPDFEAKKEGKFKTARKILLERIPESGEIPPGKEQFAIANFNYGLGQAAVKEGDKEKGSEQQVNKMSGYGNDLKSLPGILKIQDDLSTRKIVSYEQLIEEIKRVLPDEEINPKPGQVLSELKVALAGEKGKLSHNDMVPIHIIVNRLTNNAAAKEAIIKKVKEGKTEEISNLSNQLKHYELSSKLEEINKKKETKGKENVIYDVVNITGEVMHFISVFTGGGTAGVGAALRSGTFAAKTAHGAGEKFEQVSRNRGWFGADTSRSKEEKHKEYVNHAKFIIDSWIAGAEQTELDTKADKADIGSKDKLATVKKYIEAMGLSPDELTGTDPLFVPDKLVNAMKER